MKKIVLFTLAILFTAVSQKAFAFAVSYDQKVSVNGESVANIKVVVQDEKMRAESNFGGMATMMIRNETGTYSYLPTQKMATKIPASMDRPNLTRDLPHFMDFLQKNSGTKVGTEEAFGYQCDVYKFTEPTIKKDAKAWVWKEKEFPVKIEVSAPEGLTTVELTNIQFEPKIEENTFQMPADVKILDLEAAAPKNALAEATQAATEATQKAAEPPAQTTEEPKP